MSSSSARIGSGGRKASLNPEAVSVLGLRHPRAAGSSLMAARRLPRLRTVRLHIAAGKGSIGGGGGKGAFAFPVLGGRDWFHQAPSQVSGARREPRTPRASAPPVAIATLDQL